MLDLVQDLSGSITLIHEGRVVLERDLRAPSSDRFLRVDVAADSAWLNGDAAIESTTPSETRLRLRPGADALADVLADLAPDDDRRIEVTGTEDAVSARAAVEDETVDAVVARLASVVYQQAIVRTGQKVRLRSLLRSAT